MWRYTSAFLMGSGLLVGSAEIVGILDLDGEHPILAGLGLVAVMVIFCHEFLVRGLIQEPERRLELKTLLRRKPTFSSRLYIIGFALGLLSSGAAVLLISFFDHIVFKIVPLTLPMAGFGIGLYGCERLVRQNLTGKK